MRTPSTSDLVHCQANIAYDKLAILSDHIDELANIADFIFDLKEYLYHILNLYVTLAKDEEITGTKTFSKPIRAREIQFYDPEDDRVNRAFIRNGISSQGPYVEVAVSGIDDSDNTEYTATTRLTLDSCNGFKPVFDVPYTDGNDDYSAVCVRFLNEALSTITGNVSSASSNISSLLARIQDLETTVDKPKTNLRAGVDTYPVNGSNKLVTSAGVYDYGQDIKNDAIAQSKAYTDSKLSSSGYTLPTASTTVLGGIKVGSYLVINADGKLSVDRDALIDGLNTGNTSTSTTVAIAYYETWTWYAGSSGEGGHSSGWSLTATNIATNAKAYANSALGTSDVEVTVLYTYSASKDEEDPTATGRSIIDVVIDNLDIVNADTVTKDEPSEEIDTITGPTKQAICVALVTINSNPLKQQLIANGYTDA